jgi:hypothetical protein
MESNILATEQPNSQTEGSLSPRSVFSIRMTSNERRQLLTKLKNGKTADRRSAVKAMWKSGDVRFAPSILEALQKEALGDPSVWQSKCLMIAALGDLNFRAALPTLRALAARDFRSASIIYSEIAFSICRLTPIRSGAMNVVTDAMKSSKPLFARGAFQAIYYMDLALQEKEIVPLIQFANRYSKQHPDDEQLTCMPRDYLAAAAYRWEGKGVHTFLETCRASPFPHLQQIATSSLNRVRSTDSRLRWYKA